MILTLQIACILIKMFLYKPNKNTYDVHNDTGFCYIHRSEFFILYVSNLDKSAERTLNRKNRNNGKIGNIGNRDNHRNTQQQKRRMLLNKVVGLHVKCLLFTVGI
jgi:hypothetical protein